MLPNCELGTTCKVMVTHRTVEKLSQCNKKVFLYEKYVNHQLITDSNNFILIREDLEQGPQLASLGVFCQV